MAEVPSSTRRSSRGHASSKANRVPTSPVAPVAPVDGPDVATVVDKGTSKSKEPAEEEQTSELDRHLPSSVLNTGGEPKKRGRAITMDLSLHELEYDAGEPQTASAGAEAFDQERDQVTAMGGAAGMSSPLSSVRRRRRDPKMEAAFEGGLTPRARTEEVATIRVGEAFQAVVPPMAKRRKVVPASGAPINDARVGTLTWDPGGITEDGLAAYLEQAATIRHPALFPMDAACNLLHSHSYASEPAVGALEGTGTVDSMEFDGWPEEDIASFEEGVARFGKNFHKVAQQMAHKYPVSTLILFYYARWKKTSGFKVWQTLREKEDDENIAECRQCGKGEKEPAGVEDDDEGGGAAGGGGSRELLRCEGCPAMYHAECCRAM